MIITMPVTSPIEYTTTYVQKTYLSDKKEIYQNKYISYEEKLIKSTIDELKNISEYEIEKYDYEKIDDDMIALGIKLKNFPENQNKVAYSIELMNKLDDKLPDNIDIFVI